MTKASQKLGLEFESSRTHRHAIMLSDLSVFIGAVWCNRIQFAHGGRESMEHYGRMLGERRESELRDIRFENDVSYLVGQR